MGDNGRRVESCDVVVVGAGPSGCAAASLLAEKGRHVVMLEKTPFPRYRVGESLIPHCWYPLQRLGLVEKLDASSFIVHKHSVQFVGTSGRLSTPFYFDQHLDHASARTWQVVRSDFDQMLVEHAQQAGVQLREEHAASELIREGQAVRGVLVHPRGGDRYELRAPITIDASGRDAFAQNREGWRVPDPWLKKVAIWTYYEGAKRDPGKDEGATTIAYIPEKGWFWYLPLAGDVVSVGVVGERGYLYRETSDPEEIFLHEVRNQPWIADHLSTGKRTKSYQATGDYSYRSRYCADHGLLLVGDAFAFLDPVFSSGVFLALHTGILAGDAVEAAFREGDFSAARFEGYGEEFRRGLEVMRRLVYAFYDVTFNFADFLKVHPEFRADITDCLIGRVDRDFEPLFAAVSGFARVPEPLPYGRPRHPSPGKPGKPGGPVKQERPPCR